jgi:hypothetical protein
MTHVWHNLGQFARVKDFELLQEIADNLQKALGKKRKLLLRYKPEEVESKEKNGLILQTGWQQE